jgi:hypothetical protein
VAAARRRRARGKRGRGQGRQGAEVGEVKGDAALGKPCRRWSGGDRRRAEEEAAWSEVDEAGGVRRTNS